MRTLKLLFTLSFFLFTYFPFALRAQADKEGSLVKWMTLKEALAKNKTEPRPIILDFYTDWCGWCKHMMKTTYADPGLASYINSYFYPAKFDAEGKDTVVYLGKTYLPTSPEPRKPHQLAVELLNGKLMYPSTLFLNAYDAASNRFLLNMLAPGYLDVKKIEPILIFSLEQSFRNCGFDEFRAQYEKAFYDSTLDKKNESYVWMQPRDFFRESFSSKKKSLVLIQADWCNSCKVMRRTSFSDSLTGDFIKEKFNLVEFNAISGDTLFYEGQSIYNPSPQNQFHPLALALNRNNRVLPGLIVLDENKKVLDAIPTYVAPSFLKDIMRFYGDDAYKTKSWKEFVGR